MIEPDRIDASFTPVSAPAVVGVELDGEAVLYHDGFNTVHLLNSTATIIWNFLDGQTELGELSSDLAAVFSADSEVVTNDVIEAVRDFGRQGLLEGVVAKPEVVSANQLTAVSPSELPDD